MCQITFTFLLVYLFSFRNFAVGTTYSKTEIIQVALLGLILLGDTISAAGVFAIALGMVGILALSVAHQSVTWKAQATRSDEHTPELQSLMHTPYAVICVTK